MAGFDYNPTEWNTGDVITADKLNNVEEGIDTLAEAVVSLEQTELKAEALDAGATPTAVYADGVLTFGIPKGEKGDTGDTGPQGETGPQGPQGEKGEKGDTGEQGPQGETGATGPQGEKGDKGDTGDTGPQGPQGEKGDKGDTGEQGPAGADGAAATVTVGTVSTLDAGEEAAVTNAGTTSAAVFNFGIPKGEKGDKGDQGEQGPQGEKGETGAAGADGKDGANAPTITACVINVSGSTVTGTLTLSDESTVSITGTYSAE